MKRIVFLVVLCLSFVCAKDANDSQWRSFVGVEGGIGLFGSTTGFIVSFNHSFNNFVNLRGLSYGAGILGGWQKYTSEKIGMRNTFGLRAFIAPETKVINSSGLYIDDSLKTSNSPTTEISIYYALDGLFDFVKNGNNRFGMSLGFGIDVFRINFGRADGWGILFKIVPRLGFYTQFDRNIIDFNLSVPVMGTIDKGNVAYNSTLTLGYKYLF